MKQPRLILLALLTVLISLFANHPALAQCQDAAGGSIPCPPGGNGGQKRATKTPINTETFTPAPTSTASPIVATQIETETSERPIANPSPDQQTLLTPTIPTNGPASEQELLTVTGILFIVALVLFVLQRSLFVLFPNQANSHDEWVMIKEIVAPEVDPDEHKR